MADEDDDLFDDENDDQAEAAAKAAAEAEAKAKAEADAKAKAEADAAAKAAAEKAAAEAGPSESQLAELGLAALKNSFIDDAKKAGYAAADFDGIGLKGIDEAARAQFVEEAKASHEEKVKVLEAQGFVYNPDAATSADKTAQLDARDAALKEAWGSMGPGLPATGTEEFQKEVEGHASRGDVMSTIRSLAGKGGMGEFFIKGKRG